MALSANLQAALDDGARSYWLFVAELPDATRLFGNVAVGVDGFYDRLISLDGGEEQISDEKSGGMNNPSLRVSIADDDRDLSSLTESADADGIVGSVGTLYLAAEGVAEADWSERFRGRLGAYRIGDGKAQLTYRQEALALRREVPEPEWRIGQWNFPHAHESVRGALAPLIYGEHDSGPYTNQGFVSPLLIDTTGNKRHLVCAGYAKDVPAVWKNGVQQTVTTHYTIQRREVAGRLYTLIEWTAAAAVADDDVIACDVDGYEATGDGSGALITEPAAQLKHLLINFLFGRYARGDWATSHDQVDATSHTAASTFFTARRYNSAHLISEPTDGGSLIAEWNKSHEARAYWTFPGAGDSGKIAVGVEDPTITSLYSLAWLPAHIIDGLPLELEAGDRLSVDGLTVESIYDESQGRFLQTFSVTSLDRTAPKEETFSMRWGARA